MAAMALVATFSSTILIGAAAPIAASPTTAAAAERHPEAATAAPASPPERGSAAWANSRAKRTGQPQLVTDALTETETVYANPDGTTTTELTMLPTRVESEAGRWVAPDADLVRREDGTVGPKAAAVAFEFSGGGSAAPLVRQVQGAHRWSYYNSAAPGTAFFSPDPGSVPGSTVTEFDGAGRPTAVLQMAGNDEQWRTTTHYGGDSVTVIPPDGGTATTTIVDARGRTTSRLQFALLPGGRRRLAVHHDEPCARNPTTTSTPRRSHDG